MVTGQPTDPQQSDRPIRYAVVGLGHIAQVAVLPAFRHAANSEVTALVSSDPLKLRSLAKKYKVKSTYSYDQYDKCLASGQVDAVYIALPNDMHAEYAIRAAEAGIHVLCEKPMAASEAHCHEMIDAVEDRDLRLMIAYRLHFEQTNLEAIELINSGRVGEPRIFTSTFCMQVKPGDIRLRPQRGGGTLFDIGIYCINAARYLFRAEPVECFAYSTRETDGRFYEVDEMTTAVLRFPGGRLASFTASFGAADVSSYRIVGTEGDLRVEPAYEYTGKLAHHLTINGKTTKQTFARRDHFAPELIEFSDCIQQHREPEPSGYEGLADVRIIEALYRSAERGQPQTIEPVERRRRPSIEQERYRPPVVAPDLVHTESPSQ
jgi:glucose-fructose oxidoreductase